LVPGAGHHDHEVVATVAQHRHVDDGRLPRQAPGVHRADAERVDDDPGPLALEDGAEEADPARRRGDHLHLVRPVGHRDPVDAGAERRRVGVDRRRGGAVDPHVELAEPGTPQEVHVEAPDVRADRRIGASGGHLGERAERALRSDAGEAVAAVQERPGRHRVRRERAAHEVLHVHVPVVAPRLAERDEAVASVAVARLEHAPHAAGDPVHRHVRVAVDGDADVVPRAAAQEEGEALVERRHGAARGIDDGRRLEVDGRTRHGREGDVERSAGTARVDRHGHRGGGREGGGDTFGGPRRLR
jgi:hypothetical protein